MLNLRLLSGVAAAGLLAVSVVAARADSAPAAVRVTAGASSVGLAAPNGISFADATLAGSPVTLRSNSGTVSVSDSRGSGAGWQLQAQASTLTCSATLNGGANGTCPTGGDTLSGTLYVAKDPTITCGTGGSESSTCPARGAVTTNSADALIDGGSAGNVVWAIAGQGMGTDNVSGFLKVVLPPYAYAATYSSTVTLTLVQSAP